MKTQHPTANLWRRNADVSLRTDDGALEFHLSAANGGLFVERVDQRDPTARVVQSTLFRDAAAFTRWCEADAVRFDYPIIYVSLKRHGDGVLRSR